MSAQAVPLTSTDASGTLRANVVDVRRFSTHDGDGIRTTVFFKGCPLACTWCQNPETISGRIRPVFFPTRCIACGLCVDHASAGEAWRKDDGSIGVDVTREADWAAQVERCPTLAIAFDGTPYTVDELIDRVLRDRVFFRDGGGVTVSGGEPLYWPHFTAVFLRRLHELGVHTAIETALDVRQSFIADVLPELDQVFADVKILDPELHRQQTGRDNAQILDNVKFLLDSEHRDKVIVRTPLIPGVTANEQNIGGIAALISGLYPDVSYELLNYNPLAAAKYAVVPDRRFLYADDDNPKAFSVAEMATFRDIARSAGVRQVI